MSTKIAAVEVEGLDIAVSFSDYELAEWRKHPAPAYDELEDDEDHPVPDDVFAMTGIDPDAEGWDGPDGGKAFCPTGQGGGIDPTCSPGKTGGFKGKPANPDGHDTYEQYRNKDGSWTPERKALHDRIVKSILSKATPVDNPQSYLMGGGPASGKSTVVKSGGVAVPENHVAIDPDAIKAEFPEYREMVAAKDEKAASFVHEESSYLSKRAMQEAVDGGYHVMLDGTGDSGMESLGKKIKTLRSNGRRVSAIYVTCPTEMAVERNNERAKKTGRKVLESVLREYHAAVSRIVPEALSRGYFDDFELFDTGEGGAPRHVASARGTRLMVHDMTLWQEFLNKG